ncbi:hypothetical protein GH733_006256, partial [Mirounga leonina]
MSHPSPETNPFNPSNPQVFFGVDIGGRKLMLYPKQQKNFVLCVQEKKALDPPLGNLSISMNFFITIVLTLHLDGRQVVFGQVIKGMGVARILENVEVKGEKPAKLCIIAECGKLKEGDDWGIFPKDGSGDSHPDFPEDADIDLKDVDKILTMIKHWLILRKLAREDKAIQAELLKVKQKIKAKKDKENAAYEK